MVDRDSAFQQWLATRPESIRTLAAEFPLDSAFDVNGTTMYLIGYTEGDELLVSPIDPRVDYRGAHAARERLCAAHVRKGEARAIPLNRPDEES